jgi:hypothetical protein
MISQKNNIVIDRCRKLDTSSKNGKEHLSSTQNDKFKYITYE